MGSSQLLELLITQTLQVTAVIVLVWIIVRLFGKNEPYLAHSLWALVLIKCLTPPLWYSPTSAFSWLDTPTVAVQGPTLTPLEADNHSARTSLPVVRVDLSTADVNAMQLLARNESGTLSHQAVGVLPTGAYWNLRQVAVGTWLVGAGCCLATALLRLRWFWRGVAASRVNDVASEFASIEKLTRDLASHLGVHRPVRLLITHATVGPAVIGLWRPTLVLPALIVEGKKRIDIEPLIAHELIHIRRGDLWWALVQTLATCLFWFHPLVWLASRMMTREAERSCDEQTIACLRCSPAVYARCLLDVLERKHQLRIAPALPGVRPMDITKNRMERIMRLGHGSRSRTPWWTAVVFLLGAATILPGAGFTIAQEDQNSTEAQKSPRNNARETTASNPLPPAGAMEFKLKTYDVADVLTTIVRVFDVSLEEAREQLLDHLPNAQFWSDNLPYTHYQLSAGRDSCGEIVVLGQSNLPAKVIENELWVFGSDDNHQQVDAALARYHEHGLEQINVTVKFVSVPLKLLDELGIQWKSANSYDNAELRSLKEACESRSPINANSIVDSHTQLEDSVAEKISLPETAIPTAYSIVSRSKIDKILERCQTDPHTNVLQAPRITMFNRQSAMICDTIQQPFVTGQKQVNSSDGSSKSFEPLIHVGQAGSTLRMRGALRQNQVTSLLLSINTCDITRVDRFTFTDEGGEGVTVQQPAFLSRTLHVKAGLPNGESIIVKAKQPQKGSDDTVLLFVASCLVMNTEFAENEGIERIERVKKIQEEHAAELRSQQTFNEQKNQPDVFIRSAKPRGEKNLDELAQVLFQRWGIKVDLRGGLEYHIDEDNIEIRGESIFIGSDEAGLVSGDTGQVTIRTDNGTTIVKTTLQGNVKLEMDDLQATADKLIFQSDEISNMKLNGHVKLTSRRCPSTERGHRNTGTPAAHVSANVSTFHLSANSIGWDSNSTDTEFEVSGDGRYVHPIEDGAPVELSAEHFRWNAETNELKVIP